MSNGIYKSIEHRAIVNSEKERMSVATFYGVGLEKMIGPLPNLVTAERPQLYKTIAMSDYVNAFFSHKLQGKSNLSSLRIQNETH